MYRIVDRPNNTYFFKLGEEGVQTRTMVYYLVLKPCKSNQWLEDIDFMILTTF